MCTVRLYYKGGSREMALEKFEESLKVAGGFYLFKISTTFGYD